MPAPLTLMPHLSLADLERRYRTCRDPIERSHWQMVWLVGQGQTCPAVVRVTGYRVATVRTVIHRYNADGAAGLVDRRHANPGQAPLVTPGVQEQLRTRLAAPPPDGGLWTSPKVAVWLTGQVGRPIRPQRAWEVLQRMGFSLQRPRPHASAADPAAQTACKKGARRGGHGGPVNPSGRQRHPVGRRRTPARVDSVPASDLGPHRPAPARPQ